MYDCCVCVCCRDVFLSTIQPQRKHVVIMMDHGNSMSVTQLRTAKAIAKHLIASFSDNDRVSKESILHLLKVSSWCRCC